MLEKILQEIKNALKENTYHVKSENGINHFVVASVTAQYLVEKIIKKHLSDNDGWIPVEEGVPEESEEDYYDSVIVTLSDGTVRPGVYRNREDEWWVENEEGVKTYRFSNEVIAWRPLPEPYIKDGE